MPVTKITGGLIYDGSLNAPVKGDVVISDDRIIKIGSSCDIKADIEYSAENKIVCPAFVDIHRHLDVKPLTDNWKGETELRQGIGTTVVGNCGISLTPSSEKFSSEQYAFDEPVLGPVPSGMPHTYPEYLSSLEKRSLPLNIASMIGTGSVRISLKGFSDAPFTKTEMEKAKSIINEALTSGAPGISLGIMYLPECYGSIDDFSEMLTPVGRHNKVITTHIRGEGDSMVSSVAEVIEISRRAGCALEISHFKSCGMKNWGKEIYRAIELIENARASGQDVTCDFYPYEGGSTALTTMLPPAYVKGDMASALSRLGTKAGVEEFIKSVSVEYSDWDNFAITLGWERIIISGVVVEENKKFLGLTVTEGAEKYGFSSPEALAAHLMHTENGKTSIINMSMLKEDIDAVAKLSYSSIISDAIYADTDTPHPRMFGAFPKAIREYAIERKILTMSEVIHKITSLPADRMGLKDRGRILVGAKADILVFEEGRFTDHATFTSPANLSTGLDMMLLGGKKVIENDTLVSSSAGECIRVKS